MARRGVQAIVRLGLAALFVASCWAAGVPPAEAQDMVLSNDEAHDFVLSLGRTLTDDYPFPDISARYAEALERHLDNGEYYGRAPCELGVRITADLQVVHPDKHLKVHCRADVNRTDRPISSGFQSVEVDSVHQTTYIQSNGSWDNDEYTYTAAFSVMQLAGRSRYIIIDLRDNVGGTGVIGRILASYFFRPGEEQFFMYGYPKDRSQGIQEWTFPYVPGHRSDKAKLYILVNKDTFSAAEGFAFGMRNLKRATIIGQTTAGGGIAGMFVNFDGGKEAVFVPTKMLVAPHTDKGWDGVGVVPDYVTAVGHEREKAMELIEADQGR
ncbi:S41 family peptidase [Acetobacter conturbans]|nr:S41 family peptidase [Acetobacter conturbans]